MDILFTGFEPFADVDYNPSWDAAQAAAEELGVAAELLPVTLEVAREIGTRNETGRLLVHFGVARKGTEPRFERYAHNWWQGIGDEQPVRLERGGPVARECALPLHGWAKQLGWRVSHDAGTYVCNATLYYALAATPRAIFVHIPPMEPDEARAIGTALACLLRDEFHTGLDPVEEAGEESFPASDPPSWTPPGD